MNVTQSATTIDTAAPATFTCSQCPFARHIDGNRYCCQVSQTASDVKRGHWEATISCYEALAKAKAETEAALAEAATEVAAPIAKTDTNEPTSITPATPATPAPKATGENEELPNRGDNGRGRLQPMPVKKVSTVQISGKNREEPATKKLMLTLVAVKRITSDVAACNFDRNELEIAGELSLSIGGFVIPPVVVRHSSGYKVIAGHFQFHAAVLARRLNPRAGETISAIVLEAENQSAVLAQLGILKSRAA